MSCRIEGDDFQHVRQALKDAVTVGEMKTVIERLSQDLSSYLAGCELQGDSNKKRSRASPAASGEAGPSAPRAAKASKASSKRRREDTAPEAPSIDALGLFQRAHVSEPRQSPRLSDSPLADLWLRMLLNSKLSAAPVPPEAQPVLSFLLSNLNGTDEFMDLEDDGCTILCSVALAKFFKAIGVVREEVEAVFTKAGVPVPLKFQAL